MRIRDWTVDYGSGVTAITVPHAWNQDLDVRLEGPVSYRCLIQVPDGRSWLVFRGVSYSARVFVNGEERAFHEGIWDAFSVPLDGLAGSEIAIEVEVVKNGGERYPVRQVPSGFLPFVFNTFGGIYREVELVESEIDPLTLLGEPPRSRVNVLGRKLFVDDEPIYFRGLLHWGWYPELGHPNPPQETIERELEAIQTAGFNLVKFCLWAPPHRYLEQMKAIGLFAWLELPLWDPAADENALGSIFCELQRIVEQYRHHDNIIIWTCGCELSSTVPPAYRQRLYQMVKSLTGSPLVKDNSGGSEMYGGDLREYGDFEDFHPYCDLPFYAPLLDSLLPAARKEKPIFLGEFNDYDAHRDFQRLASECPFWASSDPSLNSLGVRWQFDLPQVLEGRFARGFDDAALTKSTRSKSEFIRKQVIEAVIARQEIGGFVITGIRDTPISTSGCFDDWGEPKSLSWLPPNPGNTAFLIPYRCPPWVRGGNRPGWRDPFNHFLGPIVMKVGLASEKGYRGSASWSVIEGDQICASGNWDCSIDALDAQEIGEICWDPLQAGRFQLCIEPFGQSWNLGVFEQIEKNELPWGLEPGVRGYEGVAFGDGPNWITAEVNEAAVQRLQEGARVLAFIDGDGTVPMPFWRECGFAYPSTMDSPECRRFLDESADRWELLQAVSADCALDPARLKELIPTEFEPIMTRVDTRTYAEHPILVRAKVGPGELIVSTLRPFGGLGSQPFGLRNNPAGHHLMAILMGL